MQPLWLVKTRLQLQTNLASETQYKGPLDALRKTVQKEGVRGLYRGLGASYLGLTETVLQFTFYEILKDKHTEWKEKYNSSTGTQKQDSFSYSQGLVLTMMEYLGVSSLSKLTASIMTYPHEVIRTRLREQKSGSVQKYKGPFQGIYLIAKEEGLRGLYGGLGPHLLRVVPNAAMLFLTYEMTLSHFAKRMNDDKAS